MTVYVDDARIRYGQMIMCHMVADTRAELDAMADRIGVQRKWYHRGHYNICTRARLDALAAGALSITQRAAVKKRRLLEARPHTPAITTTFPRGQSTPQGQDGIHRQLCPLSDLSTGAA